MPPWGHAVLVADAGDFNGSISSDPKAILNNIPRPDVVRRVSREPPDPIQSKISAALQAWYVPRAAYDVSRSSGCMEGTRVPVLRDIQQWMKDLEGPQIFWLTGKSGTGKSAIAQTICQRADRDFDILLGGSFFCSRSTGSIEQRDMRCIIPTFAQLLARQSDEFKEALSDELDRCPSILQEGVKAQVEHLLYKPLQAVKDPHRPILFVIDALDECSGQPTSSQAESHRLGSDILQALAMFSRFPGTLRIKFLVTSRPETLPRDDQVSESVLRLYEITQDDVTLDVRRFINARLESNFRLHQITDVDIEALTQLSGGLFIVVATALQYALAADDDAALRLKALLEAVRNGPRAAPLDSTYSFVLKDAMETKTSETDLLLELPELLAVILSARSTLSVSALAELLGQPWTTRHLRASLSRVAAVINVPKYNDNDLNLHAVHASFGDYFFDRARNNISVAESVGHDILARGCLRIMSNRLSQITSSNEPITATMNNIRSDFIVNNSNRNITNNVHSNGVIIGEVQSNYNVNYSTSAPLDRIQPSVRYACMHWMHHLSQVPAGGRSTLTKEMNGFLAQRLIFWRKVVSVSADPIDLEVSMLLGTAS